MDKLTPEFVFMKGLPLEKRVRLIIAIAAVGFALQLTLSPFGGWIFVIIAASLGAVWGKSNSVDTNGKRDERWETVTIEEVERTRKFLSETSEVQYAYSRFLSFGCLAFVIGFLVAAIAFVFIDGASITEFIELTRPVMKGGPLTGPFVMDMAAFFVVIWMGGRVSPWEPRHLRVRFEQLNRILALAKTNPQLGFQPSLQLVKSAHGTVPEDCKLLVKIKDAPADFIGIQVQVSFNVVEQKEYPYTYCVILAKREFNLAGKTGMVEMPPPGGFSTGILGLFSDDNKKHESQFARFHGSLIELEQENDMEIVVVRQDTSVGGDGYTTTPVQAYKVFSDAYLLAKNMLSK